jgi:hypothetical protein
MVRIEYFGMIRRIFHETMKYCVCHFGIIFTLSMVFFGCSCTPQKPTPDPLVGWTFRTFDDFLPASQQQHFYLEKAVADDYQGFIKDNKLSLLGAVTGFFEDGTGRRAIQFGAFMPGANASWKYVLIYDQGNKRINMIKYDFKRYQS